jgi:GNAT superfamily N-acetyltransferase
MTVPTISIRAIEPGERDAWEPLWKNYLSFYKASQEPDATNVTWARIHDPAEPMFAIGAYVDSQLQGFVHFLFHRSFWTESDYCYLQDLFVDGGARRGGLGRALIKAVADRALETGANRVYWLTQEDNHAARALYEKVADRSGFIQYRKTL